jgi:uncharacterized membrane protein HdeD (DUF308 family)
MKLSWRDIATAALFVLGAAVVFAKIYGLSWMILSSWPSAVAVLAVIGLGMVAINGFDMANRNWRNLTEIAIGVVAGIIAMIGLIVDSPFIFYSVAVLLTVGWVISIISHVQHSMESDDQAPSWRHQRPIAH